MSVSPIELLKHILDECLFIIDNTDEISISEFYANETLKRAVVRSMEIIGEAVKKLPIDFKEKYSEIEWRMIAGMRDKLIHDYIGVDYEIVFDASKYKVPDLFANIKEIIRLEELTNVDMAKSKQLQLDSSNVDWNEAIKPLLKQYKGKKHPLDYKNPYQLLVMTILSARDSDRHINQVAPKLFEAYSSMKELSTAKVEDLFVHIGGVINFANKAKWLVTIAQTIKDDKNIPTTLESLTELPGIGRKSANVILREMGKPAEGVIVDLHVLRVSPRLGIAIGTNPEKIEKQIMEKIQQKNWGDVGMCISFLGREICRPTNPKCEMCVMNGVCEYYNTNQKS
ncbi:MAG: DUF86 domain-containing protein [Ignavibacteriales bacterium]|nr:DUF86 domain-containing protein [Ignavibacteriales bacterium]